MGDPLLNCLTTACCPPEVRQAALTKWLAQFMPAEYAEIASMQIFGNLDVAPKGTLAPLVQEIARLARGEKYQ
jgi:hypothetical protein